jgi:hypothetical protein
LPFLHENNRRAKYYSLARLGCKELERETAIWRRLSAVIGGYRSYAMAQTPRSTPFHRSVLTDYDQD